MPNAPWGRLGPLRINDGPDFIFDFAVNRDGVSQLAPHEMRRRYTSVYVPVPVALSDHLPEEWKANNPGELSLSFEIYAEGQRHIEESLRKLRRYMRKDRRTGEPVDLVLVMGQRSWNVRIISLDVQPTKWNSDTKEQRAKVSLILHTRDWEN